MDKQTIAITTLSPDIDNLAAKSIRAIVTLLWPYSSATRSSSLLLADTDFRLRRNKGQVRVFLHGAAAKAVAESQIGIGDEVLLSLDGAQWQEDKSEQDEISTPGKNVEWGLVYRRRITLQLPRDGDTWTSLDVDQRGASPDRTGGQDVFATPKLITSAKSAHSTPSLFSKPGRLSTDSLTFTSTPYDPFAEGGARARKRMRRSWHDVESWTISKRTPSPQKHFDPLLDDDDDVNGQSANEDDGKVAHEQGGTFQRLTSKRDAHHRGLGSLGGVVKAPIVDAPSLAPKSGHVAEKASVLPATVGLQPRTLSADDNRNHLQKISKQIGQQLTSSRRSSEQEDDSVASLTEHFMESEDPPMQIFKDTNIANRKAIRTEQSHPREKLNARLPRSMAGPTSKSVNPEEYRQKDISNESFHEAHHPRFEKRSENVGTASELDTHPSNDNTAHKLIHQGNELSSTGGSQEQPILLADSDSDEGANEAVTEDQAKSNEPDDYSRQHAETAPNDDGSRMGAAGLLKSGFENMMPPPTTPSLRLQTVDNTTNAAESDVAAAPKTPELRGVASPTLPLPSPFPAANETTATSFLEVRPQQSQRQRRLSAPKTIKETLEEEKQSLQLPVTRDRKSRTSSSSSYRKESGPFAEHVRVAHPFGFDNGSTSAEEAVTDSPEIKPITRDIPGLKSLESMSDSLAEQEQQPPLHLGDGHLPSWTGAEQFITQSGFRQELDSPSDQFSTHQTSTRTQFEETSPDLVGPQLVPDPYLQQSFELHTETRSSSAVPTLRLSHVNPGLEEPDQFDDGSLHLSQTAQAETDASPLGMREQYSSLPPTGFQPEPSMFRDENNDCKQVVWQNHAALPRGPEQPFPRKVSQQQDVSYPHLPPSPRSSFPHPSSPPQLAPLQPTHTTTTDQFEPLTPDLTQPNKPSQLSELSEGVLGKQSQSPLMIQDITRATTRRESIDRERSSENLVDLSSPIGQRYLLSQDFLDAAQSQMETVDDHKAKINQMDDNERLNLGYDRDGGIIQGAAHKSTLASNSPLIATAKDRLFEISGHLNSSATASASLETDATDTKVSLPKGLRTSLSYYSPLHPSLLRPYLNTSSRHESTIDVIAVVSSVPTAPKRALKGPKDWHALLSITTPESRKCPFEWPDGQVRAQCFMSGANGKLLLPKAAVGDVILLRDFSVVTEQGRLGLLNRTRGCSWYVWRFDQSREVADEEALPMEEMRGAPVEVGFEEQEAMHRLRVWWGGSSMNQGDATRTNSLGSSSTADNSGL